MLVPFHRDLALQSTLVYADVTDENMERRLKIFGIDLRGEVGRGIPVKKYCSDVGKNRSDLPYEVSKFLSAAEF